uniref:Proteasome assembly chaperone 4 n=1 Tax=Glossina austeni TaxID=7395 RepID=A0A1A9USS4_GLOAU
MEKFTSNSGLLTVGESKYMLRVLKMNGSTMLFISNIEPECLDEIAVAMEMPQDKKILGTTVFGTNSLSDSQFLAERLSKRFGRQFFVSLNVSTDRMLTPLFQEQLTIYINQHLNDFI